MDTRTKLFSSCENGGWEKKSHRTLIFLVLAVLLPAEGHALSESPRSASSASFQGVLTYHNDNARTGQNLAETILTPAIDSTSFGKLFSYAVSGQVYAQPLYVPNVAIPHKGVHNVVYVVTEHDSVYAFDADAQLGKPLWQRNLVNPKAGITTVPAVDTGGANIIPEIGITSTPVIDPASGTIYVVADTKRVAGGTIAYVQRLHALSIATGAEKFGGPVVIAASMRGTGDGSNRQGVLTFSPLHQLQRAALLLVDGVVYVAYASFADVRPYHGWVIAYNARTLARTGVFNDTPDGSDGGIWQCGDGPASDASGAIFVGSANGTFDADTGGRDYGDSFLKLVKNGSKLSLTDYFTPSDQATTSPQDLDFASTGPLLLPDQSVGPPHLAVVGDKQGRVYLFDRDNLGHFNAGGDTQIVQEFQTLQPQFSNPVYFTNQIYFGQVGGPIVSYPLTGGQIDTASPTFASRSFGYPGPALSISANGAANAILWALAADPLGSGAAVLFAYDASSLNNLYDSTQAGSRDVAGSANKFAVPTIANGKVYIATQTELDVYGMLH
jgi:hypothetical protein